MSGWVCGDLPTWVLHWSNVGGLYVRMVAVHQLTAYNALAFCRFRCFPYLSQHNKYWWPMCQDGGSASAHYCQQCFGDLPTSVLFSAKASVGGLFVRWWQCFGSLLPAMLWRPTYFGASANSLRTTSIGGLCVRMVAVLQLTTANNASATYLLRYFRLLFQQRQALVAYMCQDCGSASAHYCQQCFGDLPTSVFPLTLSAKGSDGCLRDRKVVVLQLTLEPNCVSRTWPATKGLSRPKSLRSPGCQSWGNPWRQTNLEGLPFHGLRGLFSFYLSVRERFCTASAFLLLADSGSRIAIFWA